MISKPLLSSLLRARESDSPPPLLKAKTRLLTGVIVVGQEAGRKSFHLNESELLAELLIQTHLTFTAEISLFAIMGVLLLEIKIWSWQSTQTLSYDESTLSCSDMGKARLWQLHERKRHKQPAQLSKGITEVSKENPQEMLQTRFSVKLVKLQQNLLSLCIRSHLMKNSCTI